MKKYILLFAHIVFLLPVFANAQTNEIYVHNVETNTSTYQSGENISGQFQISNIGDTEVSDLFYKTFLTEGSNGQIKFEDSSKRQGPISIGPGEKKEIQYNFTISGKTTGNIEFGALIEGTDETTISWSTVPVFVEKIDIPVSTQSDDNNYLLIGSLMAVLLLVLLVAFIIKKIFPSEHLVAFVLLFSGILIGIFSTTDQLNAATMYEDPSESCITLNGISSPLPEEITNYNPGQTFDLDFSTSFSCGDLENDTFKIFTPANSTGWESKNVPVTPKGISWWSANGKESTLVAPVANPGERITKSSYNFSVGPYTVPTEPGNYTIHFLISQSGSKNRELLASQDICVTGNGDCTGEPAPGSTPSTSSIDMCPNLINNQTSVPEGHFVNTSGNCVVSKLSCNATPSQGTTRQNITFTADIRHGGLNSEVTFCWDGLGDCAKDGTSPLGAGNTLSSRVKSFNSPGIYSIPVTADIARMCKLGETTCNQQEKIFDPTNDVSAAVYATTGKKLLYIDTVKITVVKSKNVEYFAWIKGGETEAKEVCRIEGYQDLISYRTVNVGDLATMNHPIFGKDPKGISTFDPSTGEWTVRRANTSDNYLEMDGVTCGRPINCTECSCDSESGCSQERLIWNPGFVYSYYKNRPYWDKGSHTEWEGVLEVRAGQNEALEICKLAGFEKLEDYLKLDPNQNALTYAKWDSNIVGWQEYDTGNSGTKRFRGGTLKCSRPLVHDTIATQSFGAMCTVEITADSSLTCYVDNPTPRLGEEVTFSGYFNGKLITDSDACWDGKCGTPTYTTSFNDPNTATHSVDLTYKNNYGPVACKVTVNNEVETLVTSCSPETLTIKKGETATFTAKSNGSESVGHTWKTTGGKTSTVLGTGSIYTTEALDSTGKVTVAIETVDKGQTANSSCSVNVVEPTPDPKTTPEDFTVSCISAVNGFNVALKANPQNAPSDQVNYSWEILGEDYKLLGQTLNYTLEKEGNYTFAVTATSGTETATDTCSVSVTGDNIAPPTLDFKFKSNIAKDGKCTIIMRGTNLATCGDLGSNKIKDYIGTSKGGLLNIEESNNLQLNPGSYTAQCTGQNGDTIESGPRRCIGDFEVIEN